MRPPSGRADDRAVALSPAARLVAAAILAVVLAGEGGPRRNAALGALGALFGLVGADFGGGAPRFTFGTVVLRDGIGLVPMMVGLFGLGEVLAHWSAQGARGRISPTGRIRPTRDE